MGFGIKSLTRKIKNKFKNVKKRLKISKRDIFSLITATPPLNPMRLLDKVGLATSKPLDEPEEPPDFDFPDSIVQQRKKVRRFGRGQTILTSPSGLGTSDSFRPTLLGQ